MKIGVVGFGRLGKLLTRFLALDFDVLVHDTRKCDDEIKKAGARPASLKEVAESECVLLFVPISQIESVCKQIAPHLKDGTIVADACSVKEYPISMMEKNLPAGVHILGTHPMFGPDSIKDTLFGAKLILCKVRMDDKLYEDIRSYLNQYGMHLIETTGEAHDKEISASLNLTHLIGRSLMEFGATDLKIDTKGYRRLMRILEVVVNDTWELFEDMNHYNKHAKPTRDRFIKAMSTVIQRLEDGKEED